MQDIVHVAAAYISMYDEGEIPENLLSLFEKTIETNALNIEVQ
jgi:hypothetical protein